MLNLKQKFRLGSETSLLIISLSVVIPAGLLTKSYQGTAQNWISNSLSGIFYEIFWILLIALLFSSFKPKLIAATVFLVTSVLEVLQLWHPPFLELLRSSWLGRTVLGNTFVWSDFLYYLSGCIMGFFWLTKIKKAP